MEKPIVMSVSAYAKSQGVTRQAIVKRLSKNQVLPGVKYAFKSGEGKTSHFILIME